MSDQATFIQESEVARKLGVSITTLRRWRKSGRLPADVLAGVSHRPRYIAPAIEKWIGEGCPPRATPAKS